MNTLGKRIEYLRKMQNYTMQELADKCNISKSYVNDIEKGRVNPSLDTLTSIAKALNTTVSYLLGENDQVYSPEPNHSQQLDERLRELLSDPEMLVAFKGLEDMTDEEKEGLITYLEGMKIRREKKGKENTP